MEPRARHTRASTLSACVATLAGAATADVPLDDDARRAWLAGRGLGLVPVAGPDAFSWAGPWIGLRAGPDGDAVACVMFGVPSAPVFEPAGGAGPVQEGYVLAPLDVALWTAPVQGDPGIGVLEVIVLAAGAQGPVTTVDTAVAVAGRGLEGDRYAAGTGTFPSGRPGSDLTLIDAAVLDELGPIDHRRNLVVRGVDVNALVGREFRVGEVRCRGERLAEPCAVLDRANGGGVLRPLVHRAGLRATVLTGGTLRVGDAVQAIEPSSSSSATLRSIPPP